MATIDQKALSWAVNKHKETNHLYDGKPYENHLWQVVDVAKMFLHYIPEEDIDMVYAACWLHDTIEDCRVTYNDLKAEFGVEVAEIVYALTNEKGRTRKDRANDKYYEGIGKVRYAPFVKICDRIANVKYSFENKGSMLDKYQQEASEFYIAIGHHNYYAPMWAYLDSFFYQYSQK
jgi:(p)ppGpp synthase/HD superfamily hydrolase